jgi:hypothetical protein
MNTEARTHPSYGCANRLTYGLLSNSTRGISRHIFGVIFMQRKHFVVSTRRWAAEAVPEPIHTFQVRFKHTSATLAFESSTDPQAALRMDQRLNGEETACRFESSRD